MSHSVNCESLFNQNKREDLLRLLRLFRLLFVLLRRRLPPNNRDSLDFLRDLRDLRDFLRDLRRPPYFLITTFGFLLERLRDPCLREFPLLFDDLYRLVAASIPLLKTGPAAPDKTLLIRLIFGVQYIHHT